MRRGVGIAALDKNDYSTLGNRILQTHSSELNTQLETFQATLLSFSISHAKEIKESASFRGEFAKMCSVLGIDPLASHGIGSVIHEFYFELAIRIVEVCISQREKDGGITDLEVIRSILGQGINGINVSLEDIERAVASLSPLGKGFEIIKIHKRKFVRSVTKELSNDQFAVLEAAQVLGYVTRNMLVDNLDWERERAQTVCDELLSSSLVWIDTQAQEKEYWIPAKIGS